jgi:hypothetical protein
MTWTAAETLATYRPRPHDAPPPILLRRLQACEACPSRFHNLCRATQQIVSVLARPHGAHCPQRRWPGEQRSEVSRQKSANQPAAALTADVCRSVPEAPPVAIRRLAVITSYFNPQGYRRIRENFVRFAAGMAEAGAELWTIELAFDEDPFELPATPHTVRVRGTRARHLLWQKERLLNLLIGRLPADVDAIAWIDADILFLNRDWHAETCRALERYAVVQPYDDSYTLYPDGRLEPLKKSTAWYWRHDPARHTDFRESHPGFAWAARADWLRKHGLQQEMVTGGGDTLMVGGFTGAELFVERWLSPAWQRAVRGWSDAVHAEVQGAFGSVPGSILHLFHGTRANRKYRERWHYLTAHAFDPAQDVVMDADTGLLAWSASARRTKPDMVRLVQGYFAERKEDE